MHVSHLYGANHLHGTKILFFIFEHKLHFTRIFIQQKNFSTKFWVEFFLWTAAKIQLQYSNWKYLHIYIGIFSIEENCFYFCLCSHHCLTHVISQADIPSLHQSPCQTALKVWTLFTVREFTIINSIPHAVIFYTGCIAKREHKSNFFS